MQWRRQLAYKHKWQFCTEAAGASCDRQIINITVFYISSCAGVVQVCKLLRRALQVSTGGLVEACYSYGGGVVIAREEGEGHKCAEWQTTK